MLPSQAPPILLIDFDASFTASLVHFLASRGYAATPCQSVEEALPLIASLRPEIVLLDNELPGHPLVLQVLGRQRPEAKVAGIGGPLAGRPEAPYLPRPFSGRDLLSLLQRLEETKPPAAAQAAPAPAQAAPAAARRAFNPFEEAPLERAAPPRPQARPRLERMPPLPSTHVFPARDFSRVTFQTNLMNVGDLADTPVGDLLYKLFAGKTSGQLNVTANHQSRTIYVLEGVPVAATSEAPSEQLDSILLQLGFIKLPALQRAREVHKPLAEALLELDLITPEQLLAAQDRLVVERILNLFALQRGHFILVEGDAWSHRLQPFPQNPIELISEGILRHVPPNTIAQHLTSELGFIVNRTSRFDAFLPFLPEREGQRELLSLIDGKRTLQELTQRAGSRVLELLTLVWVLRQTRMVALTTQPLSAPPPFDGPPAPLTPTSQDRLQAILKAPTPDSQHLRKSIVQYGLRLESGDPWALLGVAQGASPEALREAFHATLRDISPPPGVSLPPSLQRQARHLEAALKRAYDQLCGAPQAPPPAAAEPPWQREPTGKRAAPPPPLPSRVSYARPEHLPQSEAHGAPKPAHAPAPPADPIAQAIQAIAERRWEAAARLLDGLPAELAMEPRVTLLKSWTLFNLPYKDKERQRRICRERIELALSLDPALSEGWYYLGRIAETQRDPEAAIRHYKRALHLQPELEEARQRLNALDSSRPPEPQQPDAPKGRAEGLLGWFKR